jgi:hypothetical protein
MLTFNYLYLDWFLEMPIRITHNRIADYISTDLYIVPSDFDEREGIARYGKNKDFINYRITDKLKEFRL